MQILKENEVLYGNAHVLFVGGYFQILPVEIRALFKGDTIQFGAANKTMFLNLSHQFKSAPPFGDTLRRFMSGTVVSKDTQCIIRDMWAIWM